MSQFHAAAKVFASPLPSPVLVDPIIDIIVVKGVAHVCEACLIIVEAFESLMEVQVVCLCVSRFAEAVKRSQVKSSPFVPLSLSSHAIDIMVV